MLYSFGSKISELHDSVQRKRIELQRLSRIKALLAITESQVSLEIPLAFTLLTRYETNENMFLSIWNSKTDSMFGAMGCYWRRVFDFVVANNPSFVQCFITASTWWRYHGIIHILCSIISTRNNHLHICITKRLHVKKTRLILNS